MTVALTTPAPRDLPGLAEQLSGWQRDDGPLHLHPGDLGWYSLKGEAATATALRTWSRAGRTVAIGLLDGPQLLRLACAPDARDDDELARALADDLGDPRRGVLADGAATVEARGWHALTRLLARQGWEPDEPWTPFHLDLTTPAPTGTRAGGDLRVGAVGADGVGAWFDVHRSAFRGTAVPERERGRLVDAWRSAAVGTFGVRARFLVGLDAHDEAVAAAAVWSAGPGRPGLLEPIAVHRDHRGRGYGTALVRAAAAVLRDLGASGAVVCAETSDVRATTTYAAAGLTARPPVADLRRDA